MANEFKVKNGLLVETSGSQVTGSLFVTGGLSIYSSASILSPSSSTIFSIDGAAGRIFQVDDTMSGSLHSVNTVAGLPVLEVFSDNTVRIGQYGKKAFYVSQSAVGINKEASLNGVLDVSGSSFFTGSLNFSGSAVFTGSLSVSAGVTASLFGTASFVTGSIYVAGNLALSSSFAVTSSFAITASNAISAPLYLPLTGGTITGDLNINGTASISYLSASTLYITSSQLNIGANLITVNTMTGSALRFGGLAVIDSGSSPQQSGSLLYDSVQDEWIFVHRGAASSAITSSHFLVGPETYGSVGNEIYIPTDYLVKSVGNEHMTSASIVDNGTTIRLLTNSQVTGSFSVSAGITASLQGTSSWATSASYSITSSNVLGGINNRVALWTGSTTLGPSSIYQSGSGNTANIGINTSDFMVGAAEALLVSGSTYNIIVGESTQNNYTQLNIHNHSAGVNASSDVVATNDTGNESGNFIDMGINSSGFTGYLGVANEAYIYNTGSNLLIGNTTRGTNANLKLFAGNDATVFPLIVTGSNVLMSGSLFGTASWALNTVGGGGGSSFPYSGSAQITGSLGVTGSISVSGSINGDSNVNIYGKSDNSGANQGGNINIIAGSAFLGSGGSVTISPGTSTGGGGNGSVSIGSNYTAVAIDGNSITLTGYDAFVNGAIFLNAKTVSVTANTTFQVNNAFSVDPNGVLSATAGITGSSLLVTTNAKITGSLAVGNISPNATVGRIDAANDVVAFSTSDIRFKTNVTPIKDAVNKVKNISGVEFDWIPNEEHHGYTGHDVGVIAQELENVLPELVTTRESGYKAVKYEKIVALLIEAIKEQQQEIEELKKKIK